MQSSEPPSTSSTAAVSKDQRREEELLDWLRSLPIADKLYDRRKQAALEIERHLKDLVSTGADETNEPNVNNSSNDNSKWEIVTLIRLIVREYCMNQQNANARNGGLISLASCSIALTSANIHLYLSDILPPVLQLMLDQDPRVRYYACESMYNIIKVGRVWSLRWFNDLFDCVARLSADQEVSVKNGADLVDRLLKDIVALVPQQPSSASDSVPRSESSAVMLVERHPLSDSLPLLVTPQQMIENFIPLLSERIYAVHAQTRMFLIGWLVVLDSVPEFRLVFYLPQFLDGLFGFLDSSSNNAEVPTTSGATVLSGDVAAVGDEVVLAVNELLSRFLDELVSMMAHFDKQSPHTFEEPAVELDKIISILIPFTRPIIPDRPKIVALTWLARLLPLSMESTKRVLPSLLSSVLPALSHQSTAVKKQAEKLNSILEDLAFPRTSPPPSQDNDQHNPKEWDFTDTIYALTQLFLDTHTHTRIASIDWLILIHTKSPHALHRNHAQIQSILLKTLQDDAEQVVVKAVSLISLLAKQSITAPTKSSSSSSQSSIAGEEFRKILGRVVALFWSNLTMVEERAHMIFRALCRCLDAEVVFLGVADILTTPGSFEFTASSSSQSLSQDDIEELGEDVDVEFVCMMVHNLGLLLVTADETANMRTKLRQVNQSDALFKGLYKCWSYNPASLITLCLLAERYQHAYAIVEAISESPVLSQDSSSMLSTLIQFDKLVQMIESPVFTFMRLKLLQPKKYPWLVKSLYAILMTLPQSSAFVTLRNRLSSVSSSVLLSISDSSSFADNDTSTKGDLQVFAKVQDNVKRYKAKYSSSSTDDISSLNIRNLSISGEGVNILEAGGSGGGKKRISMSSGTGSGKRTPAKPNAPATATASAEKKKRSFMIGGR